MAETTSDRPTRARLTRVVARGLFGRLNHDFALDPGGITILHGANGSGKTTLLKAISEISSGPPHYFLKVPFRELILSFDNDRSIHTIDRGDSAVVHCVAGDGRVVGEPFELPKLFRDNTLLNKLSFRPGHEEYFRDHYQAYLRGSLQIADSERYDDERSRLYRSYLHRMEGQLEGAVPNWLREFWDNFNSTLIEEQRLFKMVFEGENNTPRIRRFAEEFKKQIAGHFKDARSRYVERSQSLDKTFPHRMVVALHRPAPLPHDIEMRLRQVSVRRAELQQFGLLGSEGDTPAQGFEASTIRHEEPRKVLGLYLDDMLSKLREFDKLYQRLELFNRLVAHYFSSKIIRPSQDGFEIFSLDEQPLQAESLSSGEQHILVLFLKLLFGTLGTHHLVMIDEPELSLHARWLSRFVEDLKLIREVTLADFLLASHSPFIFQGHWEMARELTS